MKILALLLLGAGIALTLLKVQVMGFELLFAALVTGLISNRNTGKD